MLEKEFKYLLTEDAYENYKDRLSWDKVIEQTNTYYDTEKYQLSENGITFRIRTVKKETPLIQIKLPYRKEKINYSKSKELEFPFLGHTLPKKFSAEEVRALLGDRASLFAGELIRLGSLKTLRMEKEPEEGLLLCLDKNEYLGRVDYELELEFLEEEKASSFLRSLGIYDKAEKIHGKKYRFLNAYRESRK